MNQQNRQKNSYKPPKNSDPLSEIHREAVARRRAQKPEKHDPNEARNYLEELGHQKEAQDQSQLERVRNQSLAARGERAGILNQEFREMPFETMAEDSEQWSSQTKSGGKAREDDSRNDGGRERDREGKRESHRKYEDRIRGGFDKI